jgi:hypothetical protein
MATMALAVRCSRIAVTFSRGNSISCVPKLSPFSTTTTSTTPSFFTYNSGRSRRRRKRQQLAGEWRESYAQEEKVASTARPEDEEDTRSVRDIIFPQPFEHMPATDEYKMIWPTSLSMWRQALSESYAKYMSTWEGFFTSQGFIVQSKDDDVQINTKEVALAAEKKKTEVTANVKRNVEFVKEESTKLRDQVREQTGIHTTEDLRRFAGDMMKLATECVKEFMTGYRKGRDDETEKMLTQYFQELDDKVNNPKKRRRKPKRRVLKR